MVVRRDHDVDPSRVTFSAIPASWRAATTSKASTRSSILDITATLESRQALARTHQRRRARDLPAADGRRRHPVRGGCGAAVDAGADKVSLNTAALRNPELITTLARRYGSQAVIVAIDAKRATRASRLRAQRHDRRRARRGRVGARGRVARRRRDPADVDGPRRHQGRLRLRDDRRRLRRRRHSGHRLGRRRHVRSLHRRLHARPRRRRARGLDLSLRRIERHRSQASPARRTGFRSVSAMHAHSLDRSAERPRRPAGSGRAAGHRGAGRRSRGSSGSRGFRACS